MSHDMIPDSVNPERPNPNPDIADAVQEALRNMTPEARASLLRGTEPEKPFWTRGKKIGAGAVATVAVLLGGVGVGRSLGGNNGPAAPEAAASAPAVPGPETDPVTGVDGQEGGIVGPETDVAPETSEVNLDEVDWSEVSSSNALAYEAITTKTIDEFNADTSPKAKIDSLVATMLASAHVRLDSGPESFENLDDAMYNPNTGESINASNPVRLAIGNPERSNMGIQELYDLDGPQGVLDQLEFAEWLSAAQGNYMNAANVLTAQFANPEDPALVNGREAIVDGFFDDNKRYATYATRADYKTVDSASEEVIALSVETPIDGESQVPVVAINYTDVKGDTYHVYATPRKSLIIDQNSEERAVPVWVKLAEGKGKVDVTTTVIPKEHAPFLEAR